MNKNLGVYPLSEGCFTIGWDKIFHPFNPLVDDMKDRPASLLVEIQPFLIITETDYILIDTGLGFYTNNNQLILHKLLIDAGVQPNQITKVLLSHLHKDHIGGAVCKNELNQYSTAFENATYYVQKKEWDYAYQNSGNSYELSVLEVLKQSNQIEFLKDENGLIDSFIEYRICGAHTPFHQIFIINTNNKKYFFGGDVAPQLVQMKRKFIAKYDYDGRLAAQLRIDFAKEGIENEYTFLFYHDLKFPIANLAMQDGMVIHRVK
jgi:glyoxylase-like metal-dependent hydrolase (beta-lactamase superfamily II)